MLVVPLLLGALPPAGAHLTSWSTLAENVEAPVRDLGVYRQSGVAVGDSGLLLMRAGDDWIAHESSTPKDLLGAAMYNDDHAFAVGEDGTVLEYRHRLESKEGDPPGVQSAQGDDLAGSTQRVQWQIPLASLGIDNENPLGVGASVTTATLHATHPSGFVEDAPETLDPVEPDDIATGSPPVDGTKHPAWLNGHHADQSIGAHSFSLYLMQDDHSLYAMVETDADPESVTFLIKGKAGTLWDPEDLTLTRHGPSLQESAHATRGPEAAWHPVPKAQALTDADLHAVAFQDDRRILIAGSDGTILARDAGVWSTTLVDSSKTLRAIDFKDGDAYIAGGNAGGTSGAVLYRYSDQKASRISLPLGSYGLWGLDLAGCLAAGSGGSLLVCKNGSPTGWQIQSLPDDADLVGVSEDTNGTKWAAGEFDGDAAFYRKMPGGHWNRHWLPQDTSAITAYAQSEAGPVIATVTGAISILRAHAPEFVDIPSVVHGESGEPIEFTIQVADNDGDIVSLILDPYDALPEPKPTINEVKRYVFKIIWPPPADVEGVFEVVAEITDGLFTKRSNITFVVDEKNQPPVWDPHPDVTIPHSSAWTTLVQATDPDGDPLTLTDVVLPPGASFTDLGGGTGALSWTPALGDVGTHPVRVQADDGEFQVPLDFDVHVVDRQPPELDFLSPQSARICVAGPGWGGTLTFRASATDPDGGGVNYTWSFPDDGSIKYGPTVSHTFTQLGVFDVVLTVTDDAGVSITRTISVRVVDCVEVEAEIDHDCWRLHEQPTGSVRLWDHTGEPINGTYTLKVWWRGVVGSEKVRTVEGEIVDGYARWSIPHDLDPLGLNEPGHHQVYVTGTNPDGVMGPRSMTVPLEYTVSPFCELKLP